MFGRLIDCRAFSASALSLCSTEPVSRLFVVRIIRFMLFLISSIWSMTCGTIGLLDPCHVTSGVTTQRLMSIRMSAATCPEHIGEEICFPRSLMGPSKPVNFVLVWNVIFYPRKHDPIYLGCLRKRY